MIVAIEGGDAAAKRTQSLLLAERLGAVRFSFPDYTTPMGEVILGHLKQKWYCARDSEEKKYGGDGVTAPCDAAVFQACMVVNRLEVLPAIKQALAAGQSVVFDRYYASALVYGGLDGLDEEWISKIQSPMPEPDLFILLDISVEESVKRRPERRDRYEEDLSFMERVRERYLQLFAAKAAAGLPWQIVDGTGTVEDVHKRVCDVVAARRETLLIEAP